LDTNDYFRRIRYAIQLDDAEALRLVVLGREKASLDDMAAWRIKEGEDGFTACPDAVVHALLDGLILDRRGPPPDAGAKAINRLKQIDNNTVLKQLRIALSLRTDDVCDIIQLGGGCLGKSEVGALFRKSDARNYRKCGDQVARWFLAGLAKRRDSNES